ncbi:hypothetical protein KR032_010845, partial [Drosophila birchii]
LTTDSAMRLILGTLLILFLSQGITESLTKRDLKFLNRLIKVIEKNRPIRTLAVLQNSKDKNCSLQDWNSRSIPILRFNEQTQIMLRSHFNHRALALVCMDNNPNAGRLIHLAKIYENMRQERIILWMQRQPREDFFQFILKKVEEFKFVQLLILQMGEHLPVIYRMDLHPKPHFVRIANISRLQRRIFLPNNNDLMGRTAIVDANITRHNSLSLLRIEGRAIFEFARKYNVTLNLTDADSFDIQISPQFLSKNTLEDRLAYVSPYLATSMIVMVPCGREASLKGVFKQLDVGTWLLYIFCVYAMLVLVETFMLVVIYRISGRTYRVTRINPLVNLRAFRAILGMSFPVSSRDTLSLRQLFLAMSIFGMVFSNYFSCKLSALLTKQHHAHVSNFEELRASGMTVTVDPQVQSFIESDLQADFFRRVVPNAISMPKRERVALLLTLNESYAYIILKENWRHINNYQTSMGRKVFCISPDLTIVNNIPMTSVLQKDSIFKGLLSKVVTRLREAGISQHWRQNKYHEAKQAMNLEIPKHVRSKQVPLSMEHLKLMWYLLVLGYGTAAIVFSMEVLFYRVKKRNRWPRHT